MIRCSNNNKVKDHIIARRQEKEFKNTKRKNEIAELENSIVVLKCRSDKIEKRISEQNTRSLQIHKLKPEDEITK